MLSKLAYFLWECTQSNLSLLVIRETNGGSIGTFYNCGLDFGESEAMARGFPNYKILTLRVDISSEAISFLDVNLNSKLFDTGSSKDVFCGGKSPLRTEAIPTSPNRV